MQKKVFGNDIYYTLSIDEAIRDADMCFIMTEWKEIKDYYVENYKKLMKNPIVFDGRNCYKVNKMISEGINYHSIGR